MRYIQKMRPNFSFCERARASVLTRSHGGPSLSLDVDNRMKRRLIPILAQESLLEMPTKQLLGRLRALHGCEESAAFSDLTAGEIAASQGILFKNSAEWQDAYEHLKVILATREHLPSAAERTRNGKERGRLRSGRKSNPTGQRTGASR
jgi:hypothetical protein